MKENDKKLREAITSNNLNKINELIANNPELLSSRDEEGKTHLHFAAKVGNLESAILLVEADSNLVNSVDSSHNTPVHYALYKGSEDLISFLLTNHKFSFIEQKYAIDAFCSDLGIAIRRNLEKIVKKMLDCNADLINNNNNTLFSLQKLFLYTFMDGNENIIKMFLDAKPQVLENFSCSSLVNVIRTNPHLVEELIKSRAEFANLIDHPFNHESLLYLIAGSGKITLLETIIDIKPSVINNVTVPSRNPNNPHNENILHLAAYSAGTEVIGRILKIKPDSISAEDSAGNTPFSIAIRIGNAEAVKVMLSHEPDLIDTISKISEFINDRHADMLKLLTYIKPELAQQIEFETMSQAIRDGQFKLVKELFNARPDFIQGIDDTNLLELLITSIINSSGELNNLHLMHDEGTFKETVDFLIERNPGITSFKNHSNKNVWDSTKTAIIGYIRSDRHLDDVTKLFISIGEKSLGLIAPKLTYLPKDAGDKICEFIFGELIMNLSYIKQLIDTFSAQNAPQITITEIFSQQEVQEDLSEVFLHTGECPESL